MRSELDEEPETGLAEDRLLLKAVMVWDTPSAKMNCSRSSMLVRPLAVCWRWRVMFEGVFFSKVREAGTGTVQRVQERKKQTKQNKQKLLD